MIRRLLGLRSKSPPSPLKWVVNQRIKGHHLSLNALALLMQDNANLRIGNENIVKKHGQSTKHLPCEEVLTVEEALQLATQLDLPVEEDIVNNR